MANKILLKKSSTAAASPAVGQLDPGELAINTADGRLFAKNAANVVVNLPVTSISGQAITPASVQTSGTADGIKIQAGGTANSRVITLQPTTLGGNRTLTLPDATAELAMTFNPLAVTGTSPFANQKRGTIRNNFDDPTTEEAALFHGQFYNQLRFLSPALQEESADGGTTWTTSTRMSVDALGNMMRGEGEGTSVSIIPAGSATPLGYRLTWDDTVTGLVYWTFSHLYINCSTNGNLTTFKIEAFHNTTGWTEIFTGTASNWPGHVSIKHTVIPYYPTNAGAYGKLRVTFTASTSTYTTPVTLYSMEWFGGYPNGKRNAESYDRSKNVTFPAAVNSPTGYRINNGATAGQYLRGNGTQFISAGIQAGDVPTLNQSTTGSAATLTTGRTLWGQSFNGSANVSGNITTAGNIEQSWADSRVGTFYDNSYRMGFNYITASRVLNIFSTAAATGGAAGGVISFSTRVAVGTSDTDYGTERMRITNDGNVGIGTTAPAARLEVSGTSTVAASQTAGIFKILGSATNALTFGTLSGTPYAGYMQSGGSGTYPLALNPLGGEVGIGTTTPANKLHVVGTPNTTTGHGVIVVANASTGATRVTHIGLPNDAHPFLAALNGTTTDGTYGWGFFDSAATGNFEIKRRNGSTTWGDTLAIQRDTGNVGIGTTSPQSSFHIFKAEGGVGTKDATITLGGYTTQGATIASYRFEGDSNSRGLMFSTRNTGVGMVDAVTITGPGNVGIGTTAPATRLEVFGDTGLKVTRASNGDQALTLLGGNGAGLSSITANYSLQIAASGGTSNPITFLTASTERVRILGTGQVGIGTSNPQDRLHVSGTQQTTLRVESTDSLYDTQCRLVDDESDWGVGLNIGNTLGSGMFCIRSHTAGAHRFVIDTTGRVGIANAVPYARLNVGAKVVDDNSYTYDTNSLVVTHQTATSTSVLNDPKEVLLLARQGTSGQAFGSAASFQLSRYENATANSRTRFDLVLGHNSFMTSPTTVLTARSDGNVGIGNTAPGSRLVVKGVDATSAATALNVTNSADTSLLAVRNDGLATFTGQISNTLAVGTAPLAVTSTTVCTNLNADTVDGQHASAFATSAHTHGNITSDGKVGAVSGRVLVTTTGGAVTSADVINGSLVSLIANSGVADLGPDTMSASFLQYVYAAQWAQARSLISAASATHTHGSITNDGKVGSAANLPLITGSGGVVSAGTFGTAANTFCQGDDSRLSNSRAPTGSAGGDLTGTYPNPTLTASGATAGTYKSVTVDAKGRVTGGTNPTTLSGYGITDAYTSAQVDALLQGLDVKASVKAATTGNVVLFGVQTVDGISLVAGDRVLVKNQTTTLQNGIYVVSASAWARATDFDAWTEIPGAFTFVEQGTTNADSGWVCISEVSGTLNSTAIAFSQFSGAGQITAGSGLSKSGNTLSTDLQAANLPAPQRLSSYCSGLFFG